jgi:aminomethyltransferase
MVSFAGFEMPVVYNPPSNITTEHLAVRNTAGLFDVSHMGRMIVEGKLAVKFLDTLIPRDLSKLPTNKVAYCFFLNENGGFKDDITVTRIKDDQYLLTYNAGNRSKINSWIQENELKFKSENENDVSHQIISDTTAMFAFQGPLAPKITEDIFGTFPGAWKSEEVKFKDFSLLIMGSGYTGEAGCEIVIYNTSLDNPEAAITVWEEILSWSAGDQIIPCGLGARDTLRLEAGMPLYGNDIEENISALKTGLVFPALVNQDKPFFIGKKALEINVESDNEIKRVGLVTLKRGRSPRQGMKIILNEKEVGEVTSGSFSPLLKLGIGMGYINKNVTIDDVIILKTRDIEIPAKISNFPLFDKDKYGKKRLKK